MRQKFSKLVSLVFITFLLIAMIPSPINAEEANNEVTEVTIASKESGVKSDYKEFFRIFEKHNTGSLRIRILSDVKKSMFDYTEAFHVRVPTTLSTLEIVGDVEGNLDKRAIFDNNELTGWNNGFLLNGVTTTINNIEVKGPNFGVKAGNTGQNVNFTAKNSILSSVIGTTKQQPFVPQYDKVNNPTINITLIDSTANSLVGKQDMTDNTDFPDIIEDFNISLDNSKVLDYLYVFEGLAPGILSPFKEKANNINVDIKDSTLSKLATYYALQGQTNYRNEMEINNIDYIINNSSITNYFFTIAYDVRLGTNINVNSVTTDVVKSNLHSLKQTGLVSKETTNSSDPLVYDIGKMIHTVSDSTINAVTTGANLINNNLDFAFVPAYFNVENPISFNATNSAIKYLYAGNMNEVKNDAFIEESNDHNISLDSTALSNFYRGSNTDSYGNLDLEIKNAPSSRTDFLIGVEYYGSDTRFGDRMEGSKARLILDSTTPLQTRFFGGFDEIELNQPIIVLGSNMKLPSGEVKPFSVVSSKNTRINISNKDSWELNDEVILVNPQFESSIIEKGLEFIAIWNQENEEEWMIGDSYVSLEYKETTEDSGPLWYLAAKHKVFYDANEATSGTVPVDKTLYNINEAVTILGNTNNLLRDGYTFKGWNTNKDGTGETYLEGDTVSIEKNLTLYAQWKHNPVVVSFVTNNDSTIDPLTIDYGSTITKPIDIINEGYEFEGWFTSNEFTEPFDFDSSIFENTTLYAKWAKITTTVNPEPINPTEPNKPKLPETGVSNNYIGLSYLALGSLLIFLNKIIENKKN